MRYIYFVGFCSRRVQQFGSRFAEPVPRTVLVAANLDRGAYSLQEFVSSLDESPGRKFGRQDPSAA